MVKYYVKLSILFLVCMSVCITCSVPVTIRTGRFAASWQRMSSGSDERFVWDGGEFVVETERFDSGLINGLLERAGGTVLSPIPIAISREMCAYLITIQQYLNSPDEIRDYVANFPIPVILNLCVAADCLQIKLNKPATQTLANRLLWEFGRGVPVNDERLPACLRVTQRVLAYDFTRHLVLSLWYQIYRMYDLEYTPSCLTFSHNDRFIAFGTPTGFVGLADRYDAIQQSWLAEAGTIKSVAFSPDDQILAVAVIENSDSSGVGPGRLYLLDMANWNVLRTQRFFGGNLGGIKATFSPDGNHLVVYSSSRLHALLVDVQSLEVAQVFPGHTKGITGAVFSPDGHTLYTASNDCTVCAWDVRTGAREHVFTGHTEAINALAISSDGQLLATGSGDESVEHYDCSVRVWDTRTRCCLAVLNGHDGGVTALGFFTGNRVLASSSFDGTICIWDLIANELAYRMKLSGDTVWDISVSHLGELAFGSNYGNLDVWLSRLHGRFSILQKLFLLRVFANPVFGSDEVRALGDLYHELPPTVQNFVCERAPAFREL